MPLAETLLGAALLIVGIAMLRWSWSRRDGGARPLVLGGWALIVGGLVAFSMGWGAEVGITYGLLGLSAAAYGIIAASIELRRGQERRRRAPALEPEDRPTNWPRGIAKSLLAIVLSGVASIGLGIAFAVAMPMPVHDRIVVGGLLVPILWGAGMAWTLSDARLLRATLVLLAASAFGYGVAFLPKVFS